MPKRLITILFSILTICTLSTGMLILSPAETAQASETGIVLFNQTPTVSTDPTTNAYTSSAVPLGDADVPYEALDDFWGASDYLISHVQWYGVAAKWPYWTEGNPEGMVFRITFYQRNNDLTFTQIAQFSDLAPTYQTHNGKFPFGIYRDVQGYCFDVDLPNSIALTAGWISIENTFSPSGDTFLWLNSNEGNNNCVQFGSFLNGEWDHASYQDDLAFTLTGTEPRYYTVTFQAGANGSLTGTTAYPEILSGTSWESAVPALPTPVPAFGYKFGNWSPSLPPIVNADVTYTANFVPDQDPDHWFSVTFQAGAHGYLDGTSNFYDILSGTPWESAVTVPTPKGDAGYRFNSWSASFPNNVTSSATYTANFVIDPSQTFTVTYDGYGYTSGTVPTDGKTYHSGDTVTVLGSDKLQQTGFYFAGWATWTDSGIELLWDPGSTFRGVADITLYAKWVPIGDYTATLSGTRSARPDQKVTFNASLTGAGPSKNLPAGTVYFYDSTDPFSDIWDGSNWTQLADPVSLVRGKASLTTTSLTPGTHYIYAWFVPLDWETYNGCLSNVWTITIK